MTSAWIWLSPDRSEGVEREKKLYVNMANASSIYPRAGSTNGRGSVIWFLAGAGPNGQIQVLESPEEIEQLIQEAAKADRS
jgi:hypothetical protein